MAERVHRKIAHDIAQQVQDGRYGVGDRLPAERVLAERYGASRTTVREALLALEAAGLVDIRGRSGVFVRRREPVAERCGPFEALDGAGRLALWRYAAGEAAYRIALDARAADLETLRAAASGAPPVAAGVVRAAVAACRHQPVTALAAMLERLGPFPAADGPSAATLAGTFVAAASAREPDMARAALTALVDELAAAV